MSSRLMLGLPILLVLAIIAWLLKPWISQTYLRLDYLLSPEPPTTVSQTKPVSPLHIDANKNNSYFYRQSAQESFYQSGQHQIIITNNSAMILESQSFETQINYQNDRLQWLRFFLTESPITEEQIPVKSEQWFNHDSEIKNYIITLSTTIATDENPLPLFKRNNYEIYFDSGCDDIEDPEDDFAKGCMPRISINLINTTNQ